VTSAQIHVILYDMNAEPRTRYHSPLRDRQKNQTRDLILDAAERMLSRANMREVTIADVARAAEVTERTVYRHFPTRENLLAACWRRALRTFLRGQTAEVETLDQMLDLTREAFKIFDAHEGVVRALIESPDGREVRKEPGRRRFEALIRTFEKILPGHPAEDIKAIAAATHAIASTPAWCHLRDQCGLTGEQAGEVVVRAISQMVEAARMASKTAKKA
jgi:AcrR family transcriptional regulator